MIVINVGIGFSFSRRDDALNGLVAFQFLALALNVNLERFQILARGCRIISNALLFIVYSADIVLDALVALEGLES